MCCEAWLLLFMMQTTVNHVAMIASRCRYLYTSALEIAPAKPCYELFECQTEPRSIKELKQMVRL